MYFLANWLVNIIFQCISNKLIEHCLMSSLMSNLICIYRDWKRISQHMATYVQCGSIWTALKIDLNRFKSKLNLYHSFSWLFKLIQYSFKRCLPNYEGRILWWNNNDFHTDLLQSEIVEPQPYLILKCSFWFFLPLCGSLWLFLVLFGTTWVIATIICSNLKSGIYNFITS